MVSSVGSIVSVVALLEFLRNLESQLIKGGSFLNQTSFTQFYTDFLQNLLHRAYHSIEWALQSPPKPHAFPSLPLQSGFVSPSLTSC
jgi:cytochrome c oxidase subunit 1